MENKWKIRVAPSLGDGFAGTFQNAWGVETYNPETDGEKPCVFAGLYGIKDFMALHNHKGKKAVFFCGSDIRHLVNGYWLDDKGSIKMSPFALATWINKYCESWVENDVEWLELKKVGIDAKICPSFLGDTSDYELSYKHSKKPKLYTSVSGDDFELYGWDKIDSLAKENPDVEFHLYGNKKDWKSELPNVIVHGRVDKATMLRETKAMQGALRLTEFDGFSEIICESLLWGQWPVSAIRYAGTLGPSDIKELKNKKESNPAREYYKRIVNIYPWNSNI